jgi:hypothetical protein
MDNIESYRRAGRFMLLQGLADFRECKRLQLVFAKVALQNQMKLDLDALGGMAGAW